MQLLTTYIGQLQLNCEPTVDKPMYTNLPYSKAHVMTATLQLTKQMIGAV